MNHHRTDPNSFKVTDDGLVPVDPRHRSPSACYSPIERQPVQDEVDRARAYLTTNWAPSKTNACGSYGLKHLAEDSGAYVSNGSLIAAAIELGFRVVPDGSQINASIFVKRKHGGQP